MDVTCYCMYVHCIKETAFYSPSQPAVHLKHDATLDLPLYAITCGIDAVLHLSTTC